jgi:branched-chain amino acid aminotransferase
MPEAICYVNGQFLPESRAQIPVTDVALLRGLGVFDTLRTYGGVLFRPIDHLERLMQSAARIGIRAPWTVEELAQILLATLERNEFPEATVRILVTGGLAGGQFATLGANEPGLIVIPGFLSPYPDECYRDGVRVATAEIERFIPEVKSLHYLPGILAIHSARQSDPDINEVLLVNRHGRVTEGVVSNVILVSGGMLITPGREILEGITRGVVLDLAEGLMPVIERDVYREELAEADEIFLTGSVREIMPVSNVDGVAIGGGGCGPVTRRLMGVFREVTRRPQARQAK